MQTSLRKCMHCRQRAVRPAIIPIYEKEVEHDGRKYAISLNDLQVMQCDNCGKIVLDDAADTRISDALRSKAGLLSPSEIRYNRELLGLTQKQLARCLQISESTLSRWETGAQLQQRCMDRILRAYFALPALRKYYEALESSGQTGSAGSMPPIVPSPAPSAVRDTDKGVEWFVASRLSDYEDIFKSSSFFSFSLAPAEQGVASINAEGLSASALHVGRDTASKGTDWDWEELVAEVANLLDPPPVPPVPTKPNTPPRNLKMVA